MPPKTKKKQLKFTTSPTEKTTAITDILLSLVAAGGIYYLQQLDSPKYWKINTWSMSFGVLVSIIAAGIQAALKTTVKLIFQFDHNGIFHIAQIIGIMVLLFGLRLSLLSPQ